MGYKYKATMYYSDEETEAFLREKALKTNGKKSASHFLYSLVSREREVADTTHSKMDTSGGVHIYPEYTAVHRYDVSGYISLPCLMVTGKDEKSRIRFVHKDIMKAIDIEIEKAYLKNPHQTYNNDDLLIIIKTDIHCSYSDNITAEHHCRGTFIASCIIIRVNRVEWEKWGGKYDFENIRYIKYRDLVNPKVNKYTGLCQVAEYAPQDKAGAFFIPVRKTAKEFPSDRLPPILIKGIEINANKDRLRLKVMNASQKKRHFG
ncbi:hypothetical protein NI366_001774 [Salmonella enterica]|nr:hypothetical protein [Salmonella enterica]EJJ4059039.1 hypothetical protein [Salmonella enterica]EJJ4064006.1 hypothetical protein [Salmonella enterica]EJJ4092030.1 hypothetical protein [Salmonella enterica]EJJ4421238.1 hypothetical protein [Salmonella enterica]